MHPKDRVTAEKRYGKSGSKMVQVKGFMPLSGGINRETPTGRAVGQFYEWHNFSGKMKKDYATFYIFWEYQGS